MVGAIKVASMRRRKYYVPGVGKNVSFLSLFLPLFTIQRETHREQYNKMFIYIVESFNIIIHSKFFIFVIMILGVKWVTLNTFIVYRIILFVQVEQYVS